MCDISPDWVGFSREGQICEVAEEIGFLSVGMAVAVFLNGDSFFKAFHVEVTNFLGELGIADREGDFVAVKWKNKVIKAKIAFIAADGGKLLVLRSKGTIETGRDAAFEEEFA